MSGETQSFDAVVVGAGFSGMHMLKSLRDKLGLKVRVYEAGGTVGGTWYWNRYPGARCDSESYIYCFTWDNQLLQEWEWSERYPEQPEILRYLEHVAQRHDLKRDMQFNTRVTGAVFDESANVWRVYTDKGEDVATRYLITAAGNLSTMNLPRFKGLETFKGKWYHTSLFPHAGVDFTAKRVAVVGTGATAVQAIPEISQQANHLTVFQRTANFCVPARNGKVDPEKVKARKADYNGVVERLRGSFAGFEHFPIEKSALEATPEEAERLERVVAAHIEKAAVAEGIRQTLEQLCAAAPLIPHRYRKVVAARLRIDEDVAGALLQDVAELLLAETAELPEQGHAAATRLS